MEETVKFVVNLFSYVIALMVAFVAIMAIVDLLQKDKKGGKNE